MVYYSYMAVLHSSNLHSVFIYSKLFHFIFVLQFLLLLSSFTHAISNGNNQYKVQLEKSTRMYTYSVWYLAAMFFRCTVQFLLHQKLNVSRNTDQEKKLWSIHSTAATFIGPRVNSIPTISIYQLFNVTSTPWENICFLVKPPLFTRHLYFTCEENDLNLIYYSKKRMFLQTLKMKRKPNKKN